MGANFTPDMQGYTNMKPFKFWCQKVLPTIYDDSLSYYEVLCKLVKYLNTVIENMEKVEANVDALLNAFNLLQGWVNDYFDNLDVQDEIDNKLDRMVEDGTFDRYIEPIIEQYEQQVQSIAGHAVDEAREEINTIVGQGESAIRDTVILYEQQAKQYVDDAEAWARGTKDGVPVPSTAEQYHDNSKYWAQQAQQAAQSIGSSVQDAEDAAQAAEVAQEAAEQAAQSVDTNAIKTFACENSFNVFVQNCVTKSKSSITNSSSVGYDHAGMLEFTIPVPTGYVANRPEYGDMFRDKNETTGEYHPLMISVSPIDRTDAENYELVVDRTGGVSGIIDANGNQHFFVLAMDRRTGHWAADGVRIDFNVYFTLIQTKYMGTAHNGTYQ